MGAAHGRGGRVTLVDGQLEVKGHVLVALGHGDVSEAAGRLLMRDGGHTEVKAVVSNVRSHVRGHVMQGSCHVCILEGRKGRGEGGYNLSEKF